MTPAAIRFLRQLVRPVSAACLRRFARPQTTSTAPMGMVISAIVAR